jgi:hypothetical protein
LAPAPKGRPRSPAHHAGKEADMTPQDIDPSLCAEPLLESLDDGFSPPADAQAQESTDSAKTEPADRLLSPKSPF